MNEYICAHCGAHRQGDPDNNPCGCWSPEQDEKNCAAMLRQNVVKFNYIVTLRRPDGTAIRRTIKAESFPAAKLCAKAIAEEEHAKVAYITTEGDR